jgi:putative transposase
MPVRALHIPESVKDRGKWLKVQPVIYCWTSGAGWATTSYEVMKMKAISHEPMIRLEGNIAF